jgi:hypothetical protein
LRVFSGLTDHCPSYPVQHGRFDLGAADVFCKQAQKWVVLASIRSKH